jgi:hypothetical protein
MDIIFEKIFKASNETYDRSLNQENIMAMSNNNANNKNSLVFDFIFDDKGDYTYTGSEHGFGQDVTVRGKIIFPEDGVYSADIISSDGGGGHWDNIKANQEISCIINTSFWHKTTITVHIHSNKNNASGHAIIEYYA